jgi:FHA domain
MDFVGKARQLERRISRTVDAAVGEFAGQSPTAPIEIVHGVLERAEAEIQDVGRGRRLFPYNIVRLQLVTAPGDRGARARLAAVVDGPPSLSERLADRLRTSGCVIGPLETKVAYVRRRGTSWTHPDFHVEFDRRDTPRESSSISETSLVVARLKIAVIKGVAAQRSYVFTGGRIDIGRRSDVVDQRQRLIRTNHIAFAEDGPEENRTVSRRHAHIELVEHDCYRLWDDRSVHGTLIVRRGRAIRVPAGSRGMKLESDDEIVLGQARLRVALEKGKR